MWTHEQMNKWLKALEKGDVVAAPAEGVYGYCTDPFNRESLAKLIALKERASNKGLICLISDLSQLGMLTSTLNHQQASAIDQYWPCEPEEPVTLILPANRFAPSLLTGGKRTIAVRYPACKYMQAYLKAWGKPLVSTSLNLSGMPPAVAKKDIPYGITSLAMETPLTGRSSKIFDPQHQNWLR